MEDLKPIVSEKVAARIKSISQNSESYYRDDFWRGVETKILRGRGRYNPSDFSLYIQIFISPIIHNCLDFDALIEHALTSPNSIRDYWLNTKVEQLSFGVKEDLESAWKEQKVKN
jgi:hypothetical protein